MQISTKKRFFEYEVAKLARIASCTNEYLYDRPSVESVIHELRNGQRLSQNDRPYLIRVPRAVSTVDGESWAEEAKCGRCSDLPASTFFFFVLVLCRRAVLSCVCSSLLRTYCFSSCLYKCLAKNSLRE